MAIDALRFGNQLEAAFDVSDRLRAAEKKNAAFAQREVEYRNHLRLRFGAKIDQEIAAGNEVEARERRIGKHILNGENDLSPQRRQHAVVAILLHEEASEPHGRHTGFNRFGVEAFAGCRHGIRIDVGREHLNRDIALCGRDLLAEQHGERICLLARAASCDPDAQGPVRRMTADQVGNDVLAEELEHPGIAKEVRDVDEQVFGEHIQLGGVAAQKRQIQLHTAGFDRRKRHAPFDPALQRALFVKREIVRRLGAQEFDDLGEPIARSVRMR